VQRDGRARAGGVDRFGGTLLASVFSRHLGRLFTRFGVLQARSCGSRCSVQSRCLIVRAAGWSLGCLLVVISRDRFQPDEALHSPWNKTRPTGPRTNPDGLPACPLRVWLTRVTGTAMRQVGIQNT
jgi:hypothetical protein